MLTLTEEVVRAALAHQISRTQHDLNALTLALSRTGDSALLQLKGTLLKTYVSQITGRPTHVTLPDYRQPDATVTIALDPALSVMANAEAYFRRYRKAKRGQATVQARQASAAAKLRQLQAQLAQLSTADPAQVQALGAQLRQSGALKTQVLHSSKPEAPAHPRRFYTTDHQLVEVGKNARQNDTLTLTAPKADTWMHVSEMPGSHVVLHAAAPSPQALREAASLAAYFSKGRGDRPVAVDVLKVSQLQKPRGAKPGLVTFSGKAQHLTVTPDAALVQRLAAPGEVADLQF